MKNLFTKLTASLALSLFAASPAAMAANGVEVNNVSVNNTLVRVTDSGRYLLLPVQESSDDARINIVVDGKIAETIYVRLAKSKTDYTVPFDLTPYKGHNVVLDVVTPQGRGSVREAKEDACWKAMEVTDSFDVSNREKYRPTFHHTPLYGWMNDPNGMFYKDGEWHLYYQHNPYGSKWQNMTWGHSSSADLVHWTHHPEAIRPDGLGAVFSGSSVIDTDNTAGFGKDAVVAMYTSAGTSQMQSIAASTDNGTSFTAYPGNPVICLESEARDPKVFWNNDTKQWNLVLAHALDHEMLIFTSSDLKSWTLQSSFGKGLGAQGGVWECPDLFELPVAGTGESRWMFICNINPDGPFGGSGTQYFIGKFDGKTFTVDTDKDGNVPTKWLDYGKDHYATVTWHNAPSNRRTAIGWMSNWQYAADVPTKQFRSANTLPREISLFQAPDGEIYAASTPSPELTTLRSGIAQRLDKASIGKNARSFRLPSANDGVCEILLTIDAAKAETTEIVLSNSKDEKVVIAYNPQAHTLSFDRTKSGIVDFSENFPAVTTTPTHENKGKIALRLFVDRSSIEVFGNDGQCVMTNLVFPTTPYSSLSISAKGGKAKVSNLKVYTLNIN